MRPEPFPADWLEPDARYTEYLKYDPPQPSSLITNDWVSKKLLRITSWIHAGFGSRTLKTEFKTPYMAGEESFIRFESPRTNHAHVCWSCQRGQMDPLSISANQKLQTSEGPMLLASYEHAQARICEMVWSIIESVCCQDDMSLVLSQVTIIQTSFRIP
jgi:hypothetical protein